MVCFQEGGGHLPSLFSYNLRMATIKEALDNVTAFVNGFEGEVQNTMDSNKSLVREFVA